MSKKIQTIEKTGKGWKAGKLAGIICTIAGVLMSCGGQEEGVFLVIVGPVIYLIAKIGAWWYHG